MALKLGDQDLVAVLGAQVAAFAQTTADTKEGHKGHQAKRQTRASSGIDAPAGRAPMNVLVRAQFPFRLKPVAQGVARTAAARKEYLIRTGPNLLLRWLFGCHPLLAGPLEFFIAPPAF